MPWPVLFKSQVQETETDFLKLLDKIFKPLTHIPSENDKPFALDQALKGQQLLIKKSDQEKIEKYYNNNSFYKGVYERILFLSLSLKGYQMKRKNQNQAILDISNRLLESVGLPAYFVSKKNSEESYNELSNIAGDKQKELLEMACFGHFLLVMLLGKDSKMEDVHYPEHVNLTGIEILKAIEGNLEQKADLRRSVSKVIKQFAYKSDNSFGKSFFRFYDNSGLCEKQQSEESMFSADQFKKQISKKNKALVAEKQKLEQEIKQLKSKLKSEKDHIRAMSEEIKKLQSENQEIYKCLEKHVEINSTVELKNDSSQKATKLSDQAEKWQKKAKELEEQVKTLQRILQQNLEVSQKLTDQNQLFADKVSELESLKQHLVSQNATLKTDFSKEKKLRAELKNKVSKLEAQTNYSSSKENKRSMNTEKEEEILREYREQRNFKSMSVCQNQNESILLTKQWQSENFSQEPDCSEKQKKFCKKHSGEKQLEGKFSSDDKVEILRVFIKEDESK